jgi:hypothetical protein
MGQSVAEYVLIFSIVAAVLVSMQLYLTRGMQHRLKQGTDFIVDSYAQRRSTKDIIGTPLLPDIERQYEPYYLTRRQSSSVWDQTQVGGYNVAGFSDQKMLSNQTADYKSRAPESGIEVVWPW